MAYHREFWLLAGTVAPVLVVASAVGLGQFVQELGGPLERVPTGVRFVRRVLRALSGLGALYLVIAFGLVANTAVLVWSLGALDDKRDVVPPIVAEVAIGLAVVSLALQAGGIALQARRTRRHARREETQVQTARLEVEIARLKVETARLQAEISRRRSGVKIAGRRPRMPPR